VLGHIKVKLFPWNGEQGHKNLFKG